MSLGFDPADVPLHQYFALIRHHHQSIGAEIVGHGVAEAFAEDS